MKKINALLVATLAFGAATLSWATEPAKQHYMSHPGDGPQGHMMQGAGHNGPAMGIHRDSYPGHQSGTAPSSHYMMLPGDGPQGYRMPGARHPE